MSESIYAKMSRNRLMDYVHTEFETALAEETKKESMEIGTLEDLCKGIAKKIGLPKDRHIAALFENNDSNEIVGWAVLDENNTIAKRYDELEELLKDYGIEV